VALLLPGLLQELIDLGRWPTSADEMKSQNLTPWVSDERLRALAPSEAGLHLYRPPFQTVAELVRRGDPFWDLPRSDPAGLDRERALVIGDFGFGSDSPIVLDYRDHADQPSVRYLRWITDWDAPDSTTFGTQNRWEILTSSFDEFAERLGL
jgi:hypothetical protein